MGIPNLERKLRSIEGCVVSVSIPDLVKKYGKNTIVVDGFQFYAQYLYPKFDWVCGAFRNLVRDVCDFVEAFERVGVKLVFFFAEGNLDEGVDRCGNRSWIKRQSKFVAYSKIFLDSSDIRALKRKQYKREYYHTPLNAQFVVLYALRNILHCEVHLIDAGDRCDAVAYYCRSNNCLALLAQDNYYMFYYDVPCYISIKSLNLNLMTTVQYRPEPLAEHKQLIGYLLPYFIYAELTRADKEGFIKIMTKLDECESVNTAKRKIMEVMTGTKEIEEVLDLAHEEIPTMDYSFLFELLRYKYGFDYLNVQGPLKKWDLIQLKSHELYKSGQMSNRIKNVLIHKKYFNECILEDFVDFPPSSVVYGPLRKMLYGVLFHEQSESENLNVTEYSDCSSKSSEVYLRPGVLTVWEMKLYELHQGEVLSKENVHEWLMLESGCQGPEPVTPHHVDSALHPGLLSLWDLENETPVIKDKKWKLFASCISTNLPWKLLQSLPTTLVVPAAVLYYLFQVVPNTFSGENWKYLKPWEVEVFLAQCVMLPKMSDEALSRIIIRKINLRVVKLMGIFIYGCRTVRYLVEACGYPIPEFDLCPLHFFDGKLFHRFYDRSEWRRSAEGLCSPELHSVFQQMKQIIIS